MADMTDFQPTEDRVFIKLDHEDKTTDSGFIVLNRQMPNYGEVVAVGPGTHDSFGVFVPLTEIKVGDTVYFEHSAAYGTKIDGVDYVTVRASGILAVVEND